MNHLSPFSSEKMSLRCAEVLLCSEYMALGQYDNLVFQNHVLWNSWGDGSRSLALGA